MRLLSDTSDIPELPAKLAQVLAAGIFAWRMARRCRRWWSSAVCLTDGIA